MVLLFLCITCLFPVAAASDHDSHPTCVDGGLEKNRVQIFLDAAPREVQPRSYGQPSPSTNLGCREATTLVKLLDQIFKFNLSATLLCPDYYNAPSYSSTSGWCYQQSFPFHLCHFPCRMDLSFPTAQMWAPLPHGYGEGLKKS